MNSCWCGVIGIGMVGAEGVGIQASFNCHQTLQMHIPMVKMQRAAPIMAAGDVKALWGPEFSNYPTGPGGWWHHTCHCI